jgi:hypothetical protein
MTCGPGCRVGPLRVVVFASEQGGTTMEYDRPISMFGKFKNAEIDAMAQIA